MRNYELGIAAILLLLATLTPQAVAARCAGESSAVRLCACTVRTRLEGGTNPNYVLNAYFARDRKPTAEQVQQAEDGLAGVGCNGDEYFLFSRADMRLLDLRESCAVAHAGGVYAFGRDALKVCKRG